VKPKFSIIVAADKRTKFIEDTFLSLEKNLADIDKEIIIVKNNVNLYASKFLDKISKKYKCKLVDSGSVSISGALNLASSISNYENLIFFSNDDIMLPSYLKAIEIYVDNDLDYFIQQPAFLDNNDKFYTPKSHPFYPPEKIMLLEKQGMLFTELFKNENFLFGPGLIIRRRIYDEIGGSKTHVKYLHDYCLWLELIKNCYKFNTSLFPTVGYRYCINTQNHSASFDKKLALHEYDNIRIWMLNNFSELELRKFFIGDGTEPTKKYHIDYLRFLVALSINRNSMAQYFLMKIEADPDASLEFNQLLNSELIKELKDRINNWYSR
jgi:hypothetical protein